MTLGPNWAELRKEVLELSEIWIVYPVYPNLGVAGIKFFENLTLATGLGWHLRRQSRSGLLFLRENIVFCVHRSFVTP